MICRRCLLRFGRQTGQRISSRALSTTDSLPAQTITAQTTTATDPQPNGLPTATSTSIAQPFSSPATYTDLPTQSHQSKKPVVVPSSVPAGTVLKGLNFMKNKPDPVAMEDNEYPAWLWTVLAKSEESGSMDSAEGDLFAKSKKQRRIAAKALRRQQLLNPGLLEPKIPIYEQSIDLPRGDGTVAGNNDAQKARSDLTHAMRQQRRAKIKEANFLKSM